ncbi:hypothetical protein Emed_006650 [Eimeria media]
MQQQILEMLPEAARPKEKFSREGEALQGDRITSDSSSSSKQAAAAAEATAAATMKREGLLQETTGGSKKRQEAGARDILLGQHRARALGVRAALQQQQQQKGASYLEDRGLELAGDRRRVSKGSCAHHLQRRRQEETPGEDRAWRPNASHLVQAQDRTHVPQHFEKSGVSLQQQQQRQQEHRILNKPQSRLIPPKLLLQKGDRKTVASPPQGPHLADQAHIRGQLLRRAPSYQSQAARAATAAAAAASEAAASAAGDVKAARARDEAAQWQRTSPGLSAAAARHLPLSIGKPPPSVPLAKETLTRKADQLQQQQQHLKHHEQQLFPTYTQPGCQEETEQQGLEVCY